MVQVALNGYQPQRESSGTTSRRLAPQSLGHGCYGFLFAHDSSSLEIELLMSPKSSLRRSLLHLPMSQTPVIDPPASIFLTCLPVTQGPSLAVRPHPREAEVSPYKKSASHAFRPASTQKIRPCANNSKGVWTFESSNFE